MLEANEKNVPQSPDIERAVLGAMLFDKEAIGSAIEVLSRERNCFYRPANSLIFRAITDLYDEGLPVDILSISELLRKRGQLDAVGGDATLASISADTSSSANIRYHCGILNEKAMLRDLINVTISIQTKCFQESADPIEILNKLEEQILNLSLLRTTRDYQNIKDAVHEAFLEIKKRSETEGGVTGVTSGFDRLDRLTSGWQNSDFIILAGRPSMGKTALGLDFAKNAAQKGVPTAIFSLEMSTTQLVKRMLFNEGRFDGSALNQRKVDPADWTRLVDACSRLSEYPIYIDDTPGLSCTELNAKAKRLKKERNIGLVLVDYLQLMQGTSRESRQQEISSISRSLKLLAKEINVPVIALSQLSRAVEQRSGDHKPVLSDLRESGAIEQDADLVMFIYRSAVYGSEENYLINDQSVSPADVAEVIIRKQRNGPTGTILLHWIKENTKFGEFSYESNEEYF